MEIKNLAQFKRAMKDGYVFEIIEHFIKPERTGEKRVVQVLQTNGMYTGIYNDPDNELNKVNYGKGTWIAFGKASDWTFCNGVCQQSYKGGPIWAIRVLDIRKEN